MSYLNKEIPPEITEHLSLFYNAARLFNSSLDIEKVLNLVIDKVIEVFDGERGFVMLYDRPGKELRIMVARNMDKKNISEQDFSISMTVANRVFSTGKPVLSTNATLDPSVRSKSILLNEIRSILCVPITLKDEIIGVIYTDNRIRAGTFDDNEEKLLSVLADQAATAIENARLYERISDDFKKIKQLESTKAEFISIISHELRTPLVPIKGYIYTLKHCLDKLEQEEKDEILSTMEDRVDHLSRLINDLLTISSIDKDRSMNLFETEFKISTLMETTLEIFKKKYPLHNFITDIDEIAIFYGDEDKLAHAVFHILDNGAKFSPDGGDINVSLKAEEIDGHNYVKISVKDRGIGIEEEFHEEIFEKFYQVDTGSTRSFEGMGSGLYIARYVIEAHRGKINVESSPGRGSTFTVTIPLRKKI